MNAKVQPGHLAAAASVAERARAATGLDELYPVAESGRFVCGWNKRKPSLYPQPEGAYRPMHWRYTDAHAVLAKAAEHIGTDLAERRNLVMFNPVGDNSYASVRTLVTAYQMVKAGEHARAHRHTPNALRLVLDAEPGLFTVVDGIKVPMLPGDVALTPGWCWHSHYHSGRGDAYWLDFLDVPLVHLLEPMFFEVLESEHQVETAAPTEHPYYFSDASIRAGLDRLNPSVSGARTIDLPCPSMPTMRLSMHRLESGGTLPKRRSTANRIFAIVTGAGNATIGETRFEWTRGDVMVAPSWTPFTFTSAGGAQIFEVSDEPTLAKLNLLREA